MPIFQEVYVEVAEQIGDLEDERLRGAVAGSVAVQDAYGMLYDRINELNGEESTFSLYATVASYCDDNDIELEAVDQIIGAGLTAAAYTTGVELSTDEPLYMDTVYGIGGMGITSSMMLGFDYIKEYIDGAGRF